MISTITTSQIIESFELVLIDAYGVLVDHSGPLPGSRRFLEELVRRKRPFCVVSNGASKLPQTMMRKYSNFGFPIEQQNIISSGMLLEPYFRERALQDALTVVVGTKDSQEYVRAAGGQVVAVEEFREDMLRGKTASVVTVCALCDDEGLPFQENFSKVFYALCSIIDAGLTVELVVANPDIIYPSSEQYFSLAAGSLAAVVEQALKVRYCSDTPYQFTQLGKPSTYIFNYAMQKFPGVERDKTVMLGDQLYTDVLGANRAGVTSVLVESGVSSLENASVEGELKPDYVLKSL